MASGANNVPERLVNFRVYSDSKDFLGVANVELPELEAMSETVSGAGIAGEVESPLLGHYGSMTTTLTWRNIDQNAMVLTEQRAHIIDVRGSQQIHDAANNLLTTSPVRLVMKVIPKTVSLGSFEPGATTDTEQEFEVTYLKLFINKKVVVEIDKYNFKSVINGHDALASVRADLGID